MKKNKTIIRTASFALKFSNTEKKAQLRLFMAEYNKVVNFYIEKLWEAKEFHGSYAPKEITNSSDSWLSARAKQCASKQAFQVVKSQREKKIKIMPVVESNTVELDERFVTFLELENSYNEFVKFTSLGDKLKIVCPIKQHMHYVKLIVDGFKRKKSVRLREHNNNLYLDVFLERDFIPHIACVTVGIDAGVKKLLVDSTGKEYGKDLERLIEKIQRKQQGSKAFKRALIGRDHYVNRIVKELPVCNHVMEDLTGIGQGTRKRLRKSFRSKFCRWTYRQLLKRVQLRDEVDGVHCHLVAPAYTSQICNKCGFVHESNRNGELFLCGNCGHTSDADFNASKNILNRYLAQEPIVPVSKKANSLL